MATKTPKGALATTPSFQLATDPDALRQQRSQLNQIIAKGGNAAVQAKAQAEQVRQALLTANKAGINNAGTNQTNQQLSPQEQGYNRVLDASNTAHTNLFNQVSQNGAFNPQTMGIQQFQPSAPQIQQFNPQDFQGAYQKSYDSTMNEFNRTNQSAFDKQNADFQQRAAEKGWDPSSKVYQDSLKQIQDSQQNARQGAENQGVQAGLGAQNQAYGQSLSTYGQNLQGQGQQYGQQAGTYGQNLTAQGQQFGQQASQYQMPYQNLQAVAPYFLDQTKSNISEANLDFQGQQGDLNRAQQSNLAAQQFEYQKYLQAHQKGGGGGGGGGLSLQDQMALSDHGLYNNLALLGAQGSSTVPNQAVNSGIGGLASGVGQGLTNSLVR